MVRYEDEIVSRPARTWFLSAKEKKCADENAEDDRVERQGLDVVANIAFSSAKKLKLQSRKISTGSFKSDSATSACSRTRMWQTAVPAVSLSARNGGEPVERSPESTTSLDSAQRVRESVHLTACILVSRSIQYRS